MNIYLKQKVLSFFSKYYVSIDGQDVAEVVREFAFFRHRYAVNGLGWRVEGDFLTTSMIFLAEEFPWREFQRLGSVGEIPIR